MIHSRYWYFPFDPKGYNVIGAFNGQGLIYWHQSHYKYAIGDILYIYASAPVQSIICKAEVVETDVLYRKGMDNDADFCIDPQWESRDCSYCIKIIPISFNRGGKPDYNDLCNIGLTGFQGPSTLTLDQVNKIEELFQPEDANPELVKIGDKVLSPKFGEGIVSQKDNGFITVKFSEKACRFSYPSAIHRGFISTLNDTH